MDPCPRDQQLEVLRWHWGGAYDFWWDGRFRARRADDGAELAGETPDTLRRLVIADYTARPVPRDRRRPDSENLCAHVHRAPGGQYACSASADRLDALAVEDALREVEREFPRWRTWLALSGLCHAALRDGPALLVQGEDPIDLRDEIQRAESFLEGM